MPRPRPSGSPSIKDVARAAGVSAQTVSRVANGQHNVTEATRTRVERAMLDLGYVPNHAARMLRNGATHTIGLMAHRFERTGEALTMGAVVAAAEEYGYSVTLTSVPDLTHADWLGTRTRLSSQAIDALVVLRHEAATHEQLLLPSGLPIAVADSRLVGQHPAVVSEQEAGTADLVNHLLGLGHSTVHHVSGPEDSEPAQLRQQSWRAALVQAGALVPDTIVGDWSAESGYRAGMRLVERTDVSAVFCANDEMAFGVMRALHEAGLRVPDDISLAGYDDISLAGYGHVPLTTIRQDFGRIGRELVDLVLRQIRGEELGEADRVVVPTELVMRGSTAAPPSR